MLDAKVRAQVGVTAKYLNIKASNLAAVVEIESAGIVFWVVNGRQVPAARPEAHRFYAKLKGSERDKAVSLGLAHPKFGVVKVPFQREAVYDIIERMKKINETAALESCSWGLGQVMGENWKSLGYASVQELVAENMRGVDGQLECMARFIRVNGLVPALQRGDFTTFAKRYNGPAYKTNAYDTKMAAAAKRYEKLYTTPEKEAEIVSEQVKAIQRDLSGLGCYSGAIDGLESPELTEAIKRLQTENGLVADGKYGAMTARKVEELKGLKDDKTGKNATAVGLTGTAATSIGEQGLSYIRMLPEHPMFKLAITILTVAFVGLMIYGLYLQFRKPEAANA